MPPERADSPAPDRGAEVDDRHRYLPCGESGLAAIASIVTRSRLPGHTVATALTDGYAAGLLAGSVIFAAGAVVAVLTVNARIAGQYGR